MGLLVLVMGVAGGSYLWFRSQVVASNARVPVEVKTQLTDKPSSTLPGVTVDVPASPSAMNVLVLGSDHRAQDNEEYGRSDTIIILHIDPDNDYLSILSIPRDLRVQIPGHGTDKINAAYAIDGPALTIKTVEALTGIDINHYMEVDFKAFQDMTDALGGVYVDVDRRYYHVQSSAQDYETIKLAPGYQLLKGSDALDYVRFRHDLTGDFGRMQRQQRFLAALREQAMGWNLPFKLPALISALFDNISTDLGANDFLKLAYWGVRLPGSRMRQVSINGDTPTIGGISYVVADEATIAKAVTDFLNVPPVVDLTATSAKGSTSSSDSSTGGSSGVSTSTTGKTDLAGIQVDILNANGRSGEGAAASNWLTSLGATIGSLGNASQTGLRVTKVSYPSGQASAARLVAEVVGTDSVIRTSSVARVTLTLGEDFVLPKDFALPPGPDSVPNSSEWKALAKMVPFAVEAPSYLPEGFKYYDRMPPTGATYDINTGGGTEPAFKMIYQLRLNGRKTDEYMGITETVWTDAPAASKGIGVKDGGITYTIVGSNQKVDHIWWKQDGVLYWVSNTLSYVLSRDELLTVAESMVRMPTP
ncbi:MAG: LCP family protein [Actinobacteria bacterium]|nr:LCP family protein [Actinomycetota bacterium]